MSSDMREALNKLATVRATNAELLKALERGVAAWSTALSLRHGGTPENQREPVLNAMRAAIKRAKESEETPSLARRCRAKKGRTNMILDKLIAALEKATGPSRELDLLLEIAAGRCDPTARYISTIDGIQWIEHHPEVPGGAGELMEAPLPHYTGSLDAALTLVQDGCAWMVRRSQPWDAKHPYHAAYVQRDEFDEYSSTGSTPAIALCIAWARSVPQ